MGWGGPLTHRQLILLNKYLNQQWNNPDRHDWYLMRICQVIGGLFTKGVKLEDFKIPFDLSKTGEGTTKTAEQEKMCKDAEKVTGIRRMTKSDIARAHREMLLTKSEFMQKQIESDRSDYAVKLMETIKGHKGS